MITSFVTRPMHKLIWIWCPYANSDPHRNLSLLQSRLQSQRLSQLQNHLLLQSHRLRQNHQLDLLRRQLQRLPQYPSLCLRQALVQDLPSSLVYAPDLCLRAAWALP